MLIGIDGNEANIVNRVGSNVYAHEVIKQLHRITRNNLEIKTRIYLKQSPLTPVILFCKT